ncbi:hypothetical protein GCM10023206_25210 [Acinetobacter puyangensis]|uniref:Peptidoglycan/LPS O-acetylase OafA/YrhL, contains acyltransferase and SGNH-hydrolase domains n=1 Tax=Acinetobacter puyangensis TaxID=1096779 RepID=A0A240E757_9GAMM|nr:acyltransferase [Acinetobacter puyangensis]SNX43710.1 Peptidoglycan/LPS O-acetylase OafA/YrhL, contains acyltransferase and SGNH-hydrolase domains [Acinetobacter puyangensis]
MISHDQALPRQFSLQLDSLRGLSAIIVLFSHCFQAFIGPLDLSLYSLVRLLGQAAVMMFFVLSGYLIGHSIQKNIYIHQQFQLKSYFRQRCKRILPPFIFALLLVTVLYHLAPDFFYSGTHQILPQQGMMIRENITIDPTELIGSVLFLNGFLTNTLSANAPLWSLSYEVWFYVLAACLALYHRIGAILLFIGLISILSLLNLQFFLYFCVWLLAFAFSFPAVYQNLNLDLLQPLKISFFSLAALIAIFDFYQFQIIEHTLVYRADNFSSFNVCVGIALSCWLLQLRLNIKHVKPVFAHAASYSYTLYVTHFPILLFILGCGAYLSFQHILMAMLFVILSMLFCIGFAYVTSKFLEPQKTRRKEEKST